MSTTYSLATQQGTCAWVAKTLARFAGDLEELFEDAEVDLDMYPHTAFEGDDPQERFVPASSLLPWTSSLEEAIQTHMNGEYWEDHKPAMLEEARGLRRELEKLGSGQCCLVYE